MISVEGNLLSHTLIHHHHQRCYCYSEHEQCTSITLEGYARLALTWMQQHQRVKL